MQSAVTFYILFDGLYFSIKALANEKKINNVTRYMSKAIAFLVSERCLNTVFICYYRKMTFYHFFHQCISGKLVEDGAGTLAPCTYWGEMISPHLPELCR